MNRKILVAIVAAVLVAAGGWYLYARSVEQREKQAPAVATDTIVVDVPKRNQLITSPVTVSGKASGWYFEGSFPVEIVDANGRRFSVVEARAQGDWMTTDFVPFTVSIPFHPPATDTGTVILRADNPSGLPENDQSVSIPVRFR